MDFCARDTARLTKLATSEKNATELQAKLATAETHATELQARLATAEKHATDLEGKLATAKDHATDLRSRFAKVAEESTKLGTPMFKESWDLRSAEYWKPDCSSCTPQRNLRLRRSRLCCAPLPFRKECVPPLLFGETQQGTRFLVHSDFFNILLQGIQNRDCSWDGGRRVKTESGRAWVSAMDTGVYTRSFVLLPGAGQG
jgi:hypothetical protein